MSEGLFRRARLPLDQACWQAGVDLNEVMVEYQKTRERMARKGVPAWKQELVGVLGVGVCWVGIVVALLGQVWGAGWEGLRYCRFRGQAMWEALRTCNYPNLWER
jgi:hypothetical protein